MNEKDQPSPEQLLKLLDLQMQTSRQARTGKSESRSTARFVSLALILGALGVALWILMTMLEEMRPVKPDGAPAVPAERR